MRPRHAATALILLAACRGDLSTQLSPPDVPAYKVDVTASRHDVLLLLRTPSAAAGARGGQTVDLDAAVSNPQGHVLEHKKHTEWRSSDNAVATVDTTGLITAQDTGDVLIIVDEKKAADTVRVRIVPVPVRSVTVTGPDSIGVRDTVAYIATALDSAGEALVGREVSWHSTNGAVLKSLGDGAAEALVEGSAQLEATVDLVTGRAPVRVWPATVAAVTVSPATLNLPQFRKTGFTAVARDRHGVVLTGRPVTWASSAPTIVQLINTAGDSAATRDVGTATITATIDAKAGRAEVTVTDPVEARALWVTRFEYTGSSAVDFTKIATIFQKAASAHFNVVYFQVRTSGDALYFSDIEPCSPRMCGKLGGPRPAQDPLDVALAEAAKYGIQVHAWINAYTGFIGGSTAACNQFIESTPRNWLKAHPEWSASTKNFTTNVITRQVDNCVGQTEYMYISPGVPEVRSQVAQVSADLARRYGPKGLRGIHLDRIRFSANTVSYDSASLKAFRAATGAYPTTNAQATWLNFRRGFVNQGVKEVWDSLRKIDPTMALSAAVWPGYMPKSGWSATWSYTDLFQDPQAWAAGGYLDVEVPMDYPATATSTSWTVKAYCSNTDWTCVLDDHIQRIEKASSRQVYIGVGAIRGWDEMAKQIDVAHDRAVTGMSVYSYGLVDAIPNGWAQLAAGPFKNRAIIPVMPWK